MGLVKYWRASAPKGIIFESWIVGTIETQMSRELAISLIPNLQLVWIVTIGVSVVVMIRAAELDPLG
jgi:hypothetical protein